MELKQYKAAVEAMLFACGEPISAEKIAEVLETEPQIVKNICEALADEYEAREQGICLLKLDNKYQLASCREYGSYVQKILDKKRNAPLSNAALETLAVIAYNQPVTRSFIEQVRGVESSAIVAKLMERDLVEEAGRMDLPGRPLAFRTTDGFLRTFGLQSLSDLPPLHEEETPLEQLAAGHTEETV